MKERKSRKKKPREKKNQEIWAAKTEGNIIKLIAPQAWLEMSTLNPWKSPLFLIDEG